MTTTPREFPGDARYVVTAPLVMAHCGDAWRHLYVGDAVPTNIRPEQRDKLLRGGMISLAASAPPEPTSLASPARDRRTPDAVRSKEARST